MLEQRLYCETKKVANFLFVVRDPFESKFIEHLGALIDDGSKFGKVRMILCLEIEERVYPLGQF